MVVLKSRAIVWRVAFAEAELIAHLGAQEKHAAQQKALQRSCD